MEKNELLEALNSPFKKRVITKNIKKEIKRLDRILIAINKSPDLFFKQTKLSREEQLVRKHFTTDEFSEWLSATECLHLISKVANAKVLAVTTLGKALTQLDFQIKNPGGYKKYLVTFYLEGLE